MSTPTYNPSPTFGEAAAYLSNATALSSVSDATKLELYGIFKCLTVSPTPSTSKPSIFNFTGRAKWDAWQSAGETYKERPADAENRYLEIARSLGWYEGQKAAIRPESTAGEEGGEGEEDIWATDEELAQRKSEKSAMGRVMSTMTSGPDEADETSTLWTYALSGDAQGLVSYLEKDAEVDVNARDENGYTPLHLAADRGHVEVVKVLLSRGADPAIKDEDEYTAKELAEIAGHDDIVDLLSGTHNASS
ncbi:ankyrin [Cubamyces lactineus]|nr:ankyrin [Cubamyces lactineus]